MSNTLCPVLAVDHKGIITQTNVASLLVDTYQRSPGTKVKVSCYVPTAFTLVGPRQVQCGADGNWSPGIPSCVRKSDVNNGLGGDSGTTTNDNSSVSKPVPKDPALSDVSIIVITLSVTFVLILLLVVFVILCRHRCHRGYNYKRDSLSSSVEPRVIQVLPSSPKVSVIRMDTKSPARLLNVYRGPGSAPTWHSHPIISRPAVTRPIVWTDTSVDRYIRELDSSRRKNPNHSWRDFTSLSSYYSLDFSVT